MFSFEKMGEKFLVGVGLVIVLVLTLGSGSLHNLSWDKLKQSHWQMVTGKTQKEIQQDNKLAVEETIEQELVPDQEETSATLGNADAVEETLEVVLYYGDDNGENLKAEVREIPKKEGIARATITELLKGPADGDNLQNTIPAGTKLNDIDITDGICTVDFSSEIRDNHWGGSTGEMLTVYSIVNVLTQFPTVKEVKFLIDGQVVNTLVGHMDLSQPFERNADIIK